MCDSEYILKFTCGNLAVHLALLLTLGGGGAVHTTGRKGAPRQNQPPTLGMKLWEARLAPLPSGAGKVVLSAHSWDGHSVASSKDSHCRCPQECSVASWWCWCCRREPFPLQVSLQPRWLSPGSLDFLQINSEDTKSLQGGDTSVTQFSKRDRDMNSDQDDSK